MRTRAHADKKHKEQNCRFLDAVKRGKKGQGNIVIEVVNARNYFIAGLSYYVLWIRCVCECFFFFFLLGDKWPKKKIVLGKQREEKFVIELYCWLELLYTMVLLWTNMTKKIYTAIDKKWLYFFFRKKEEKERKDCGRSRLVGEINYSSGASF